MISDDLNAVSLHAIERWVERAGGFKREVKVARRIKGGANAQTRDVLLLLEDFVPGFSSELVAKRILDGGGRQAIEMGCTRIKVDGLSFVIRNGRILTTVGGKCAKPPKIKWEKQ